MLVSVKRLTISVFCIVVFSVSCSTRDDRAIFYTNESGSVAVAENSLNELIAVCEAGPEPCIWDAENLVLTVGELDEEVEIFGADPDMQYVLEFSEIPEGLMLENATMITGKHHVPSVLGSPDVVPDEYHVMRHSAAVNLDWFI